LQSASTEQIPDSSEDQLAERKSKIQPNDFERASERVREVSKRLLGDVGKRNKVQFILSKLER